MSGVPPGDHLFRSFFQAGFECSTHKLRNGKRLDLVESTAHDRFARQDFERLRGFGVCTAREGVRWHKVLLENGEFDFSSVHSIIEAARSEGIQIIWDLFHFGWPDRYSIFSGEWLDAFDQFAGAFASELKNSGGPAPMVIPINEISFFAWAGGDVAYLNPFEKGRGGELKRQMVRAWLTAVRRLRETLPDVTIAAAEPVIHIIGDPAKPGDQEAAEQYRLSMFEAWDMILGRRDQDLGGSEDALDVIGVNFYDRNEWWNFGETMKRDEPDYRPFHEILDEVYQRYRKPMFVSETGIENEERPSWLAYIVQQVRTAMSNGVLVGGICLYPILNHPGWDDDRHCYNGLWDYAQPDGTREIYGPLAAELRKQQVLMELDQL
jgi:beta-glucosidase/6-phospho-beta-glucosidase/beta-galactosidase